MLTGKKERHFIARFGLNIRRTVDAMEAAQKVIIMILNSCVDFLARIVESKLEEEIKDEG